MDITFGICISPISNISQLNKLIDSIRENFHHSCTSIGNYEILTIGASPVTIYNGNSLWHIPFNEDHKRGWITAKKNILAKCASYDNLVVLHDYYLLDENFHLELNKFDEQNPNWELLVPKILTKEGSRHSDWLLNSDTLEQWLNGDDEIIHELWKVAPTENHWKFICRLPDNETRFTGDQYISGGCMICKTKYLLDHPWAEKLVWGQKEDILWAEENIDPTTKMFFVENAVITCQKPNKWATYKIPQKVIDYLMDNT